MKECYTLAELQETYKANCRLTEYSNTNAIQEEANKITVRLYAAALQGLNEIIFKEHPIPAYFVINHANLTKAFFAPLQEELSQRGIVTERIGQQGLITYYAKFSFPTK